MKYHFIGIGGIGVGTLASLMLAKGHQVSGSDLKESAMSASLRQKGAKIFIGPLPCLRPAVFRCKRRAENRRC